MTRRLSPRASLDTLKQEAKRWLKLLRAGDPKARTRLEAVYPKAPMEPGLRDIQQALAREYGVESWAVLREKLTDHQLALRSREDRVAEFLENACLNYGVRPGSASWDPAYPDGPDRRALAARIFARHPDISRDNIHVAVVCGDLTEVERILSERPDAASEKGGVHKWEPLLFLCFGRLPVPPAIDNAVAIADALLSRGADPNVYFTDGGNHFSPLTGAIGEGERPPAAVPPHPQAEALVLLLLDRGAEPFDIQALYNTSMWHDDDRWLELLFRYSTKAGKDDWNRPEGGLGSSGTLNFLLDMAVARNHLKRAEWLLKHGANPNRARPGENSLEAAATLKGLTAMVELLVRFGSRSEPLLGEQAFQAACMRLDRKEAMALLARNPEYLLGSGSMMAAAEHDRPDVIELLLDLGMSTEVEDRHHKGKRALHEAAGSESTRAAALLVEQGAEIDCRDRKYGATPLGWAVYLERAGMVELLSRVSRDVFSLAVSGRIERLRELLTTEPALATSIIQGETPLFHLPPDDDLAVEIAKLFLDCGTDVTARNGEGLTAEEWARRQGLDEAADVIASRAS